MIVSPPKFFLEGYIISGENGWGTEDAKLKPDAPQWAKDEYEQWKKAREQAKEENMKY